MQITQKQSTCMYVVSENEEGKWGVSEHFKKLDASYDGIGWSIPIKYKEEVEEICRKTDLLGVEIPIEYESFEALKNNNILRFFKQKATQTQQQINELANKLGIEHTTIDEILSCENVPTNHDGSQLLDLVRVHGSWIKKISYIENKILINTIPLPQASDHIDNEALSYLLENNSEQKISNDLKCISSGVDTGYTIGDVKLKFSGGVISIIAAPTSHGKTSSLINFALGVLENNPEISAYFFTYEEHCASILSLFLNTFVGKPISANNRESIATYFREGSTQYITENMRDMFLSRKQIFFDTLINTGRLRVYYEDKTASELINAIHFIKKTTNVGLVCIDYMQLLKLSKHTASSRQEELKKICLMLKDCAIDTGLPIVLTAQFNRTVVAEADLSPVNIGEAGDIERIASLIIGMFNRKFMLNREGNKDRSGATIEKEDAIYFEVLKGRGIGNGHNTVMDFDGNVGKLTNRSNAIAGFENMAKRNQGVAQNEAPKWAF